MKRLQNSFLKGDTSVPGGSRGAITVFLAVIFMALLIFAGIFVDAARIAVADRKVQSSLNTAVRSALAGYDQDLTGDYGMFGLDTQSSDNSVKDDIFKYFKENLVERHKDIRIINYDAEDKDLSVEYMGNLLTNDVFKQQIIKYMKYKAPITITETVIDKFKQLKMGDKVNFAQKEKLARDEAGSVKDSISKLNTKVKEIGEMVGKTAINNFKTSLKNAAKTDAQNVIDKLRELQNTYKNAKDTVNSIKLQMAQYEKIKQEADTAATEVQTDGNTPVNKSENQFGNGNNTEGAENAINTNIAILDETINSVNRLKQQIENIKNGTSKNKQAEINQKLIEIKGIIDGMQLESVNQLPDGDSYTVPEPDKKDVSESRNNQGSLNNIVETLKDKLLLNSIKPEWEISDKEFADASKQDAEKFAAVTEDIRNQDVNSLKDEKAAEAKNSSILTFLSSLVKMLSDAATGTRDNIYITEYIMDKFTFATSHTERGHFFSKGEVEYILMGQNTELTNVTLVLAQLTFTRFAIDTLDYFITSKIPHPAARLIEALIQGALRSVTDVYELYTTNTGCSICPSLPNIKLRYSDHLRVFLLLKSESEKLNNIRRLMQINIIQNNNDFKLKNFNTIINAKVEVRVNLWFLPLVHLDKLNIDKFKNGKFVITKEVMTGY